MTPSRITALGDQAALVYFDREADAAHYADALRHDPPAWLVDVVPAYLTVGVHFDADAITLKNVLAWFAQQKLPPQQNRHTTRRHRLPVCYEMNLDGPRLVTLLQMSEGEIIALHQQTIYTIYAIGFVPGFPYMGYLPTPLQGTPRLESPRLRVPAGSVGMTGKQTGIYSLERPGGWNIIGRTPLQIVDVEDAFFPLRVGDEVQFTRIDEREFRSLEGDRLPMM